MNSTSSPKPTGGSSPKPTGGSSPKPTGGSSPKPTGAGATQAATGSEADRSRNRLLGALVGLMALACVLLALLLLTPARQPAPTATATVTVSAAGQPQQPGAAATQQIRFDDKGFGQLGDRARRQDGDPLAVGRKDAPVVLVEWADYACPFCAVWARDQQKQIIQKYVDQGVVRLEWRDLVIFGEKSQRAAQAARAAGLQGKFWAFHEALFAASPTSGHPDLTDDTLKKFAQQAGVPDLAKWTTDMSSPAVAAAVRKDTAEANGFGASSTPVFSVNGVPLVGAQPLAEFERVIDAAAQEQKKHAS